MKNLWVVFIASLLICQTAIAQDDKSILTDLLNEDQRTVEALALYPKATRRVILESAGYPDALARMESIQEKTQEKFQDIISPYNQDIQVHFYELARYPGLLTALVSGGKKSVSEIKTLSEAYPGEVHEHALKLGRKRYQELREIQQLNETANETFQVMLQDYPNTVRAKLEQLLTMPEVLDILMKNFQSTVVMGAIYKRNPDFVWHLTDSLQTEIANKRAVELADWQATLENDPEALKELESAAEDFAEESGYDPPTYRSYLSEDDFYYRYHLTYMPYSYWLGYPSWYVRPLWYPRPYWYYWGFYYGPVGQVVFFDFPSWYFVDWYFSRNYHHSYYPHLSNRYLVHYERHRNSTFSATSRIRTWTDQNRNTYSRDWLKQDEGRIRRLQDFGSRELRTPTRQVPTYTRPSIQRTPVQRQPTTRPDYNRPTQVPVQPKVTRPPRQLDNQDNRRAPEYHEQNVKKRTPVRVSPPQNRKQEAPSRITIPQPRKKTPVRRGDN